MCTVALLFSVHPCARLVVGLNRDEWKARPADPVHAWPRGAAGEAPIVAGRDRKSGGAWFAVGPSVFAALTNFRGAGVAAPGERTRGHLVVDAARASSVEAALGPLRSIAPGAYGPFHLLVCDGARLVCATNAGVGLDVEEVPAGAHVLGNFGLDNPDDPIVRAVTAKLGGAQELPVDAVHERLQGLLREEGAGGPHVDLGPYGTRSSATVSLWPVGEGSSRLWVTDGSPRGAAYEDRSQLLRALGPPA